MQYFDNLEEELLGWAFAVAAVFAFERLLKGFSIEPKNAIWC